MASGSTEKDVSDEATNAVVHAKENADIVSSMLPYRENWAPELERAMAVYVSDFMEFAEIFGEYAAMAGQVKPDAAVETASDAVQADPTDAEMQDEGDAVDNNGTLDDSEHSTTASEM